MPIGNGHSTRPSAGVPNPAAALYDRPMSEIKKYPPPPEFAARALIDTRTYASMYRESVENTEAFWAREARERLTWITPFTQVKDTSFDAKDLHVRWFADGELNVAANCLDRHLAKRADQVIVLAQGRVIERGTHGELLRRGGEYADMYRQFVSSPDGDLLVVG